MSVRRRGGLILVFAALLFGVVYLPMLNPTDSRAFTAVDPSTIAECAGNPECFAFTIDTRLNSTGGTTGSATSFSIPTSGNVGNANHPYNWTINWGDGTADQPVSGSSGSTSPGIDHNYAAAGPYQITIRPTNVAAAGWMNAFGFFANTSGANADANKHMLLSIDTPFTNMMRTKGASYRFASIFYDARNATGIPDNLFSSISTTGDTTFMNMFYQTFNNFAYNSTSATIPAGLFDAIDTSSGVNFAYMFCATFNSYARNSSLGTIPAGLFDAVNTQNGTNFSLMFFNTFLNYAYNSINGNIPAGLFRYINTVGATNFSNMFDHVFANYAFNSTVGTIPAGLFDSISTPDGTAFSAMFSQAFSGYARNSLVGTIPAGLFDAIDTDDGVALNLMFSQTFNNYAYTSTMGIIPENLFDNINTSSATNTSSMFNNVFTGYATRKVTFIVSGSSVGSQTFSSPYLVDNKTAGTGPTANPTVSAGDQVVPTYNSTTRNITAPAGYAAYKWYRTDGTSCAVATPTPDCGMQDTSSEMILPNNQEWTPATSTEWGSINLYGIALFVPVTVVFDSNGGSAVASQTVNSGSVVDAPIDPALADYMFSGWYDDVGLIAAWDFTAPVTSDMTLYAKWEKLCEWNPSIIESDPNCVEPPTPPSPTNPIKPIVPGAPNAGFLSEA